MLNAKLDREEESEWRFVAKATDANGGGLTGYADVIVVVDDINDNSPTFPDLEYRGSVPENSVGGEFINSGFLYSAHIQHSVMLKELQHSVCTCKVCETTCELWDLLLLHSTMQSMKPIKQGTETL